MNTSENSWKILTIPNMITVFRILLIGPITYLILQEERTYFYWGLGLMAVGIASDYLDGILARKLNQVSEVGKILDPLADKIGICTFLIALTIYRDLPGWVAGVIIGRDVLILLGGLIWSTKQKNVVTPNFLGKFTINVVALMVVAYFVKIPVVKEIFAGLAVFFTIFSGIVYLQRFITNVRLDS